MAWACAQRGLDGLVVVVLLVTAAVGVAGASAPRPTPEGQWEAARWRAFREHLRGGGGTGMRWHASGAAGPPVTGRFLAYATAFGCGASWLAGMAAAGIAPRWYGGPQRTVGRAQVEASGPEDRPRGMSHLGACSAP